MSTIKLVGHKALIPVTQIMYVLGDGNYSDVYLASGKRILSSMTLKAVEVQSGHLLRISKSTLINPDYVKSSPTAIQVRRMVNDKLIMGDGTSFAVARRRWALMDAFKPDEAV